MILEAKYQTSCANECGVSIRPGDEIVMLAGGGAAHAQCPFADTDEIGHRPANVCDRCFLTHPKGECEYQ